MGASSENEVFAHLRRSLKSAQSADAVIELSAEQVRCLVDEIGRLSQSTTRLRRQNRRVRVRYQQLLAKAMEAGVPGLPTEDVESPETDAPETDAPEIGHES